MYNPNNVETEITIVQKDTFEKIKSAVNKLVDFVRPTYGPSANKVIISKDYYKMVVDDGVQISRDFELRDPAENAIVKIIREAAIKTNDRVGDGTTSSLLILQAIINEVARSTKIDGRKISKELKQGLEDFKTKILASAKQIESKEDLKKVALISFDNEEIAEMIADTYFKLGKDGIITIDKTPGMKTIMELSDGLKLEKGYVSPYMVTNPDRMEAVLENPLLLITDYRLTEVNDVLPILQKMMKEQKTKLVIICESIESNALATVINNLQTIIRPDGQRGPMQIVCINAPTLGDNRTVTLEDIALMTGAKAFMHDKGDKLEEAEIKDLGQTVRFIARKDESVIVEPKGDPEVIKQAIADLKKIMDETPDLNVKNQTEKRMGRLNNKIAVIKVGAPTENEQKALKYKVEDAVNAVKVAFKGGVVCGSGIAMAKIKTSSPLLNEALKYPSQQIFENMGIDPMYVKHADDMEFVPMNLVTGETGDFMEIGVVDPVDVLIAGVESAISIANILLTSYGIIVENKKDSPAEPF